MEREVQTKLQPRSNVRRISTTAAVARKEQNRGNLIEIRVKNKVMK